MYFQPGKADIPFTIHTLIQKQENYGKWKLVSNLFWLLEKW